MVFRHRNTTAIYMR